MRNLILAAGVAALALTAPAMADPNKGQGGGQKGQSAQKSDRGGGKADRGAEKQQARQAKSDRGDRGPAVAKPNRGREDSPRNAKAEVRADKADRSANMRDDRGSRVIDADRDDDRIRIVRRDFDGDFFRRGRVPFDCPPGLDRKDNGCMPPGQVKNLLGARLSDSFSSAMVPLAMRNWYPDDDQYLYRSGDGFIYRVNRSNSIVDGLIPLFGSGYYAVGDPWPQPYNFYNVPNQYRSYWNDGDDHLYRFGDGAIYRLDPTTNAVNAIVALLAGDLGVGSRLPMGYDAYNVPLAYRSQYADSSDAWYRYNDGYIYQVDPTTRLITAVIDAIV